MKAETNKNILILSLIVSLLALVGTSPRLAAASEHEEQLDEEQDEQETSASPKPKTDHDEATGSFGAGFLGTRFVPVAQPASVGAVSFDKDGSATLTIVADEMVVPLFGGRYWLTKTVGVELGVGFNVHSGSVTRKIPNPDVNLSRSTEIEAPSTKAFAGRLAVPLSVYATSHLNVMLIPELDVGFSSTSIETFDVSTTGEPLDLELSGFVFGLGGRVGAELSFGFIDVPQLSLQSSWGLRFESRKRSGKIVDAEMALSETAVGTSWHGGPWDILVGSLGVLYYF